MSFTTLPWQEPKEELNKLLLVKVSDQDRDIDGKNDLVVLKEAVLYQF